MPSKTTWIPPSSLFASGGSSTEKGCSERNEKGAAEPPAPSSRKKSRATRKIRRLTYLKTKPLPSLPPKPKAPPLPPKVLRRIFAFSKSSHHSEENRNFLIGCALVCRAWVFPSRAVTLSGRICLGESLKLIRALKELLCSPYCTIAPHIQWVDIAWSSVIFEDFISDHLQLLMNLVRLDIGVNPRELLYSWNFHPPDSYAKKAQLPTKLQILGIKWWDQNKRLVTWHMLDMSSLLDFWFSPFPLRVLEVEESQFGSMFAALPLGLTSKTIFGSVERLELRLNQESFLRPPHANLRYLPQLTHLTLAFQSENRCKYGAETALTLLESIRSPLRSVHLRFDYPFELSPPKAWRCLDAFLSDRLPRLRHLSLARVEPVSPVPLWDELEWVNILYEEQKAKQNKAEKAEEKKKPLFQWKTEKTKIAFGKAKPKILKKFLPLCLKKGLFATDDEELKLDGFPDGVGANGDDTGSIAFRCADMTLVRMSQTEFIDKEMPDWDLDWDAGKTNEF